LEKGDEKMRSTMRYYKASKSRSQGREFYSIIFRHPVKKDSTGKSGLRIRRGLGTSDPEEADKLINQMNELLRENLLWNTDAKHIAEKLYDHIVISAFYNVLEKQEMASFIIAYKSGLGKGWDIIGAIDVKDALEKFKEKEPDIYKLCQSPYGTIHIAKEEDIPGGNEGDILVRNVKECPYCHGAVHRYE
jgi:hypothetical protein